MQLSKLINDGFKVHADAGQQASSQPASVLPQVIDERGYINSSTDGAIVLAKL